MASSGNRAWIAAATAAAVRLAAEAGAEVDEVLGHADASPGRLAQQVVRLRQSAEITEVAADLAALLWAECEDVPPITTILDEPETQAALEAVAEARRQAAARLEGDSRRSGTLGPSSPPHWADAFGPTDDADRTAPAGAEGVTAPRPPEVELPPVTVPPAPVAAPALATEPAPVAAHRPGAGAVLAGAAAAAIVLFGRKLRRA